MKHNLFLRVLRTAIVMLCWATTPTMAVNFNEAVDGDFSNNRLAPTLIALELGSNQIQGQFGQSPVAGVADLDYFTINVPAGQFVNALVLTNLASGGNASFLGVEVGNVISFVPGTFDPSPILGWSHISSAQTGSNLLPFLNAPNGLALVRYAFWINETNIASQWRYGFDIQVSAVPEPGTYVLTAMGLVIVVCAARRARNERRRVSAKRLA